MLLNYYMVTLAEYVASSAYGSLVAILIPGADHCSADQKYDRVILCCLKFSEDCLWQPQWLCMCIRVNGLRDFFRKFWRIFLFMKDFMNFVDGIFDYTHVVYFISVIVFFLFLTVQSLEKRRYN